MFEARRLRKRLAAAEKDSDLLDRCVLYVRAGNSDAEVEDSYATGPCARCVTAATPTGPAVLRPPAQRAVAKAQPVLLLGTNEMLLHTDVVESLGDEQMTGLALRPVVLPDGGGTKYVHAIPQAAAPRLSPSSVGVETETQPAPCQDCRRDQRYDERTSEAVYVLTPGEVAPVAWLATWEHFGRSRTWHQECPGNIAAPRFLVTGAVRERLVLAGARVDFAPVRQQR